MPLALTSSYILAQKIITETFFFFFFGRLLYFWVENQQFSTKFMRKIVFKVLRYMIILQY